MAKKKKDPDISSKGTLALQELVNGLDTLSQRVKNAITAANIEWPEDSQEGNSDRKFTRNMTEGKAGVQAVWDGVEKVNAKFLPAALEVSKKISKDGLEHFQETSNLGKKIITDHLEAIAAINKSIVDHPSNGMMPVIVGNQIASTREVAQDSNLTLPMYDAIKTLGNSLEVVMARIEALERGQNDANKPKTNQPSG